MESYIRDVSGEIFKYSCLTLASVLTLAQPIRCFFLPARVYFKNFLPYNISHVSSSKFKSLKLLILFTFKGGNHTHFKQQWSCLDNFFINQHFWSTLSLFCMEEKKCRTVSFFRSCKFFWISFYVHRMSPIAKFNTRIWDHHGVLYFGCGRNIRLTLKQLI